MFEIFGGLGPGGETEGLSLYQRNLKMAWFLSHWRTSIMKLHIPIHTHKFGQVLTTLGLSVTIVKAWVLAATKLIAIGKWQSHFQGSNTPLSQTLVDLLAKPSFSHLCVATPVGCCELGRYPRKGEKWGTATSLVPKSRAADDLFVFFVWSTNFQGVGEYTPYKSQLQSINSWVHKFSKGTCWIHKLVSVGRNP